MKANSNLLHAALASTTFALIPGSALAHEPARSDLSGHGSIVSDGVHGTLKILSVDTTTTFVGAQEGEMVYLDPETIVVDEKGEGSYHLLASFTGVVQGVECTYVLNERGAVTFGPSDAVWEGEWKIFQSTCGIEGSGESTGELTFTGPGSFVFEGGYAGRYSFESDSDDDSDSDSD